jgi:hypothetical protein
MLIVLLMLNQKVRMGGWGTRHMRAYAPSIAQGEGRSLGEWRIGVISLRPLTIHQKRKIAS